MNAAVVFTFEYRVEICALDGTEGPMLFDAIVDNAARSIGPAIQTYLCATCPTHPRHGSGFSRSWKMVDVELDEATRQAWKEAVEKECAKP